MTDFAEAAAQFIDDQAKFHSWLIGPAGGAGSTVDLGGGTPVKTPARIASENAVYETVQAVAIAAGNVAIDVSLGSVVTTTLNANATLTGISGATAGKATSFLWELTADGTARTMTLPGTVTAMNGAYTPTSTNGNKDRLFFDTIDGVNWRMWVLAQGF